MTQAVASRFRKSLAATVAVLSLGASLGCGGGDELAPPVPIAQGPGMATVTLAGVDLGQTPLVTTGISQAFETIVEVFDELGTFEGDPPQLTLANKPLAPSPSVSTEPCFYLVEDVNTAAVYAPGLASDINASFHFDTELGIFTANSDGSGGYNIADGTEVRIAYCFRLPIFTVGVGVSLPAGDFIQMVFYNIPEGVSGMRNTNVVASNPPVDGSFAFNIAALTELTVLNGSEYRLVDDPAQNDATIISADMTNLLNPCIEGRVLALMEEQETGAEDLLEVNFSDPDCP